LAGNSKCHGTELKCGGDTEPDEMMQPMKYTAVIVVLDALPCQLSVHGHQVSQPIGYAP